MKTNENIRYDILKAFANFQIIEKIPKINIFFFDEKSWKTFGVLISVFDWKISMFMTSVEIFPFIFNGSSDFESELVNDLRLCIN